LIRLVAYVQQWEVAGETMYATTGVFRRVSPQYWLLGSPPPLHTFPSNNNWSSLYKDPKQKYESVSINAPNNLYNNIPGRRYMYVPSGITRPGIAGLTKIL